MGRVWYDWREDWRHLKFVVVYVDRLKDGNSVEVNDSDGRLPRDESSWPR